MKRAESLSRLQVNENLTFICSCEYVKCQGSMKMVMTQSIHPPSPKQAFVNSGLHGGEAFVNLLNCGEFHIFAS